MKYRPIVALLDDDEGFRKDIRNMMADDAEIRTYATEEELLEALSFSQPDLLLLDLDLGNEHDGFEVLDRLREAGYEFPVMLLTILAGSRTTAKAVEYDIPFLNKDRDIEDVNAFRLALLRAIEHHLLKTEVQYYRSLAAPETTMREFPWPATGVCEGLKEQVESLATDAEMVILTGERGAGKLMAAQWMHQQRKDPGPLVTITARDRDPGDFEAELYGSEDGRVEPGALAAASGGTTIIAGLEELPVEVLQRLNLVASAGSYRPRGAGRPRRLATKIIVTCQLGSQELDWPQALIDAWQSRTIEIPALRHRPGDLAFHARTLVSMKQAGGAVMGALNEADIATLAEFPLFGNFHDLALAIHLGVGALAEAKEKIRSRKSFSNINLQDFHRLGWHGAMGELEKFLALSVYEVCGWKDECWNSVTGLPRATMYKKKRLAKDALREMGLLDE